MCCDFPSTNADITLPRHERERLILAPSLRRIPSAPVLLCRSDPAKSTRLSLPTLTCCSPVASVSHCSIVIVNIYIISVKMPWFVLRICRTTWRTLVYNIIFKVSQMLGGSEIQSVIVKIDHSCWWRLHDDSCFLGPCKIPFQEWI